MATVIKLRLNLEKFKGVKTYKGKNGEYVDLAVFVSPEINQFNQNVSACVNQTKEESDSGAPKVYVGNGRVTKKDDFDIVPYQSQEVKEESKEEATSDLPF